MFSVTAQADRRVDPQRVTGYLQEAVAQLVGALEEAPRRGVEELSILPVMERELLLERFNATSAAYPREKCIHELFEEQVRRTPDAVALVYEEEQLTYAQLNARANQLAHHLMRQGVRAGEYVGVLLERSVELVIGELAVLKCGAAYVPLDVELPEARQALLLKDCGIRVMLSSSRLGVSTPAAVRRVNVDELSFSDAVAAANSAMGLPSESIAYVMYTSGSSGEPKGVLVPHRAISRLVLNNGYA